VLAEIPVVRAMHCRGNVALDEHKRLCDGLATQSEGDRTACAAAAPPTPIRPGHVSLSRTSLDGWSLRGSTATLEWQARRDDVQSDSATCLHDVECEHHLNITEGRDASQPSQKESSAQDARTLLRR